MQEDIEIDEAYIVSNNKTSYAEKSKKMIRDEVLKTRFFVGHTST